MDNPTTRQYPRTLNEAFPRTMEYGACIYKYPRQFRYSKTVINVCLAMFVAIIVRNVCTLL